MKLLRTFYLLIFICILFIFDNCPIATNRENSSLASSYNSDQTLTESYDVIEVSDYAFSIEWDAPVRSTPNAYRIYYKEHSSMYWTLLDEIPANQQLEYEINYNDLDGKEFYEFGISAIYLGEESLLHYSLDNEAEPASGWYVKWTIH